MNTKENQVLNEHGFDPMIARTRLSEDDRRRLRSRFWFHLHLGRVFGESGPRVQQAEAVLVQSQKE